MDTLQKRLKFAMARANVDIAGLARRLEISYQAVKKAVDGKTFAFGSATNFKAAHFLGVDPNWLSTGDGPWESGPVAAQPVSRSTDIVYSSQSDIPILTAQTTNQWRNYLTGELQAERTHRYHGETIGTTFAFDVPDDMMKPDFLPGTLAIIETDIEPRHGDIVLIADVERAYLRRLVIDGVNKMGVPVRLRVNIIHDLEANVYVAQSPDLDGLTVEAHTMDEIKSEALTAAGILLELQLNTKAHAQADFNWHSAVPA